MGRNLEAQENTVHLGVEGGATRLEPKYTGGLARNGVRQEAAEHLCDLAACLVFILQETRNNTSLYAGE